MKEKYTTLVICMLFWWVFAANTRANDISLLGSTPIESHESNPIFKVYPNPSDGKSFQLMFMAVPSEKMEIIIYNSIGNIVYKKAVEEEITDATLQIVPEKALKAGLYFVVVSLERQLYMQRLLVK